MVKSKSCFKLITCGGNSGEKDEYQMINENKDSNDKRGWSFRKRSARHRVLSNTVITETSSSANKESTSEFTSTNFQAFAEPNVVEKVCTTNFSDEKYQLSSLTSTQISETVVTEIESKVEVNQPESDVIIIQSAIRGFLAQRALLKSKNAVKLQAAFRGHLVRRHAVGTLRCVQAIVKMQVLVRARRAQQSHSGNEHHVTKSNVASTSTEKLLRNRFARQLLESTPKNKPIHVKCDPSKSDSAWKWLERWMSVSSADPAEYNKPIHMSEQINETKESPSLSQLETTVPTEVFIQSDNSKSTVKDLPLPSEDQEKITTYDAKSPLTSSRVKDNLEHAPSEKMITHDAKVTSTKIDYVENEKMELDGTSPQESSSFIQKPEIDEQRKQSLKRFASDQLENEGKKIVNGSRKTGNPAFIAVQSKFEELSSMANSGRSNQDATSVESKIDTPSVAADNTAYVSKEFFSSENSATYPPSIIVGSECGTELSISSTLDSPERLTHPESKIDHGVVEPNSDINRSEVIDDISGNMIHSVEVQDSTEQAAGSEKNASSDLLRERQEAVLQDTKLSPEASPRSQQQYQLGTPSSQLSTTIAESQGTPSSQVSVKPKDSKINKHGSRNRRRILSVGNKSPANGNHDSGSKGSREQTAKDHHQSGKRRNSFGSVKSDHIDQDQPSDYTSNNSSSLPRFMQATESARAKINANNSPRSSPDVHDQDIHIKKRHSLPGSAGRQGSPRIQRAAQPNTKGNGEHALNERKWQR